MLQSRQSFGFGNPRVLTQSGPGADRIVLTGLAHALKPGERVPITLQIETAAGAREEITVDAEVRTESPFEAERRAHRH